MRAAGFMGIAVCTALLAAAGGCDCAACAQEERAMDDRWADLDDFYAETGTRAADWSWGDCAFGLAADLQTAQYCARMVALCERQRAYNDCVAEHCGSEDEVDSACT